MLGPHWPIIICNKVGGNFEIKLDLKLQVYCIILKSVRHSMCADSHLCAILRKCGPRARVLVCAKAKCDCAKIKPVPAVSVNVFVNVFMRECVCPACTRMSLCTPVRAHTCVLGS